MRKASVSKTKLGTFLRQQREQRQEQAFHDWTQLEVAKKIGATDDRNVRRWEAGGVCPSSFYLKKLAELYDVDLKELQRLANEPEEDETNEEKENEKDEEGLGTKEYVEDSPLPDAPQSITIPPLRYQSNEYTSTNQEQISQQFLISLPSEPPLTHHAEVNTAGQEETTEQPFTSTRPSTEPFLVHRNKIIITTTITVLIALVLGMLLKLSLPSILGLRPYAPYIVKKVTFQDYYNQLATKTPVYNNAFQQQDIFNWSSFHNNTLETSCGFKEGEYHALAQSQTNLAFCFAHTVTFTNFALQVDMTVIRGASGGIIYRADGSASTSTMYRVRIGSDGTYDFYVQDYELTPKHEGNLDPCPNVYDIHAASPLYKNRDASISHFIETGISKMNTVTLIAVGHNVALFVNGHQIEEVCDTASGAGLLGVFAAAYKSIAEVAYNNLKLWKM